MLVMKCSPWGQMENCCTALRRPCRFIHVCTGKTFGGSDWRSTQALADLYSSHLHQWLKWANLHIWCTNQQLHAYAWSLAMVTVFSSLKGHQCWYGICCKPVCSLTKGGTVSCCRWNPCLLLCWNKCWAKRHSFPLVLALIAIQCNTTNG